jgi:hypothetical protein
MVSAWASVLATTKSTPWSPASRDDDQRVDALLQLHDPRFGETHAAEVSAPVLSPTSAARLQRRCSTRSVTT